SLRRVLAGETLVPLGAEPFEIARSLAHGHVAAVLGTVRRLGLDKALPKGPRRRAKLILAMIVARIIEPAAKLATARQLSEATAAHSLGAVLVLYDVTSSYLEGRRCELAQFGYSRDHRATSAPGGISTPARRAMRARPQLRHRPSYGRAETHSERHLRRCSPAARRSRLHRARRFSALFSTPSCKSPSRIRSAQFSRIRSILILPQAIASNGP